MLDLILKFITILFSWSFFNDNFSVVINGALPSSVLPTILQKYKLNNDSTSNKREGVWIMSVANLDIDKPNNY